MARSIGLDIGTYAVRAAEIDFGRNGPVVLRMGQVALPPGAVVAGEVTDPAVVASALRRLWAEAGFSRKRVIVGVAHAHVFARTADVPSMPESELRSALRFQVQDLIPIPVDQAVLDYQIIDHLVGDEGQPMLRVMVVAAQMGLVQSLLAALDLAGLSAERIDYDAFALVRSLAGDDPSTVGAAPTLRAIVDIGEGTTNVVVHRDGRPRFARTLGQGGAVLTEAVRQRLDVDLDEAEVAKRVADPLSPDPQVAAAGQALAAAFSPLMEEIRGTLEFFVAQAEEGRLAEVRLTGGASRTVEVRDRLAALLRLPVEKGDPFADLVIGDVGLDAAALDGLRDLFAVAIGLSLSGEQLAAGERRMSLLPTEVADFERARRDRFVAIGAVGVFVLLLLGLFLVRQGQVADARRDADAAEARTQELQAELASLGDVGGLEAEVEARRATASAALEGEIAWTRLFNNVSAAMPGDVWLTSFTGTGGEAPSIQVSGSGIDQTSSARWILRVGELDAIADLWLPSSTLSGAIDGSSLVTFSSQASLTDAALSDRAAEDVGRS